MIPFALFCCNGHLVQIFHDESNKPMRMACDCGEELLAMVANWSPDSQIVPAEPVNEEPVPALIGGRKIPVPRAVFDVSRLFEENASSGQEE